MKRRIFGLILFLGILCGPVFAQGDREELFQISTIGALLEGVFDGDATFAEVKEHGDFGIGTLNGLDGEMVFLDGVFYQIRSDGKAYPVDNTAKTPFVAVTFFHPTKTAALPEGMDYLGLQKYLDSLLSSPNLIYAVRITGEFSSLKTRSVAKQVKPYPKLVEATKNQAVFEFENVRGTFVGFYFPKYMSSLNVPGYHFHFINDQRTAGGHVLDCRVKNAKVEIDVVSDFEMRIPKNGSFLNQDLSSGKSQELAQAETVGQKAK